MHVYPIKIRTSEKWKGIGITRYNQVTGFILDERGRKNEDDSELHIWCT